MPLETLTMARSAPAVMSPIVPGGKDSIESSKRSAGPEAGTSLRSAPRPLLFLVPGRVWLVGVGGLTKEAMPEAAAAVPANACAR